MADQQKVLQEMQIRFPKLPADMVKACVFKYSFDREKCLQHLIQLQMKYNPGPNVFGQDVNQNNPITSGPPGTARRTSYPLYHNGNHEGSWNDPLRSAPASDTPFHFGRQTYAAPYRPIHETSAESPFTLRIPSPTQAANRGGSSLHHSPHSISPGGTRVPSPARSPHYQPPMVTSKPLQLHLPEYQYEFQPHVRNSNHPQQQAQHISTLEISPGANPFESSQFRYYTGPSSNQQPGGSHTTSFNVQIPSPPKPNLTTQIFVQTTLAHSPTHYTAVSTSPSNREPALIVPPVGSPAKQRGRQETEVGFRPVMSTYHSKQAQDEKAYTEALLVHQRAGLDLLSKELAKKKAELQKMKADLFAQEQRLYQRSTSSSNNLVTAEETSKLCDEIRKLRVDCHCMTMEVDLLNSNQVPLGVTDENFYKHIFPGQAGNVGSTGALVSATATAMAVARPTQHESQSTQKPDHVPNGLRRQEETEERWKCSRCTFANHPCLSVCEICEIPRVPLPSCGNGPARL